MKFFIFIFSFFVIFDSFANKSEIAIIKNLTNNEIIFKRGEIEHQFSPCSTFKIALSLMGFDSGLLQDELNPKWNYNEKYKAPFESWKSIHYPKNWIEDSCVWFSKELVKKLGIESFKNYLSLLHYGNQDISGDFDKNNGYLHCWLSSSLKISPIDQLFFLEKLFKNELPISIFSQEKTKNILYVEEINEYKLFGKTGAGFQDNGYQFGWFIGWITNADQTFIFAILIQDDKIESISAGKRAKEKMKQFLISDKIKKNL